MAQPNRYSSIIEEIFHSWYKPGAREVAFDSSGIAFQPGQREGEQVGGS